VVTVTVNPNTDPAAAQHMARALDAAKAAKDAEDARKAADARRQQGGRS
jgi:hypothetical protein